MGLILPVYTIIMIEHTWSLNVAQLMMAKTLNTTLEFKESSILLLMGLTTKRLDGGTLKFFKSETMVNITLYYYLPKIGDKSL